MLSLKDLVFTKLIQRQSLQRLLNLSNFLSHRGAVAYRLLSLLRDGGLRFDPHGDRVHL